tara:strand:- start:1124 stop:1747 length:624 start_codon:yes stop_codon:yes gene_type:complete
MKHTKITKKNVGAAIRDDKAHMDYLKRDINYDAKHGHSDINMTADEKHISKLAGDVRADNSFLSKHYTHNRVFSHGGPGVFEYSYGGESVELKDQMSPAAMYDESPVQATEEFKETIANSDANEGFKKAIAAAPTTEPKKEAPTAMMDNNPVLYVDGAPAYYMTPIKDVEGEGEGESGIDAPESSLNNPDNPNRKVASKMGQRGSLR